VILLLIFHHSVSCSQDIAGGICSDCEQSWTACPHCKSEYCSDCGNGELIRCKGEGCSRLNCYWCDVSAPKHVTTCCDEYGDHYNHDHAFCLDCRVKFVCEQIGTSNALAAKEH
jgi:hypothetical protein